jgi:hypothetical protein
VLAVRNIDSTLRNYHVNFSCMRVLILPHYLYDMHWRVVHDDDDIMRYVSNVARAVTLEYHFLTESASFFTFNYDKKCAVSSWRLLQSTSG